ncbi:MAG: hypothetical protein R3F59_26920 [Myxococcota bacterium]
MGIDTSVCKPWVTGGADLPGSTSTTAPLSKYRPPSWFEDCAAGMVSVSLSESTGVASAEASTLYLGKDADTIYFDSELGLSVKLPVPGEDMLKNKDIDSWKDLIPTGSATVTPLGQASIDTGAVDAEWDLGVIAPEEATPGPENWVLVHMAKFFFETGEAELDDRNYDTVGELMERLMVYDATHPGAEFMLEVKGGASNRWDSVKRDLERLKARHERGEIDEAAWAAGVASLAEERATNNELLAAERAGAVHYAIADALMDMENAHVMEEAIGKSEAGPETISEERLETLGEDEDSDYGKDRAVRVSVFYRVPSK